MYSPIAKDKARADYNSNNSDTLLLSTKEHEHCSLTLRRPPLFLPWFLHALNISSCLSLLVYTSTICSASRRTCLERTHAWPMNPYLSFLLDVSALLNTSSITCKESSQSIVAFMLDAFHNDYQDIFWNDFLWYQSLYEDSSILKVNKIWHEFMQCPILSSLLSTLSLLQTLLSLQTHQSQEKKKKSFSNSLKISQTASSARQPPRSIAPATPSTPSASPYLLLRRLPSHHIHCQHYL